MPVSEEDRLAADVACGFRGDTLPGQEFKSFWEAGMRYAELTRSDPADSPEGGRSGAQPDGYGGGGTKGDSGECHPSFSETLQHHFR